MATTKAQVYELSGMAARRMAGDYYPVHPIVTQAYIRAVVAEAKRIGNPRARLTAQALLRQLYMDIFGEEPTGKREFVTWVQSSLSPTGPTSRGVPATPFDTVSLDDAFDAVLEDIS